MTDSGEATEERDSGKATKERDSGEHSNNVILKNEDSLYFTKLKSNIALKSGKFVFGFTNLHTYNFNFFT